MKKNFKQERSIKLKQSASALYCSLFIQMSTFISIYGSYQIAVGFIFFDVVLVTV